MIYNEQAEKKRNSKQINKQTYTTHQKNEFVIN